MKIQFDLDNYSECQDVIAQIMNKHDIRDLDETSLEQKARLILMEIENYLCDEIAVSNEWVEAHVELRKKAPAEFDRFWEARNSFEDMQVVKGMRSLVRYILGWNQGVYLPFNRLFPTKKRKHKGNGAWRSKELGKTGVYSGD